MDSRILSYVLSLTVWSSSPISSSKSSSGLGEYLAGVSVYSDPITSVGSAGVLGTGDLTDIGVVGLYIAVSWSTSKLRSQLYSDSSY